MPIFRFTVRPLACSTLGFTLGLIAVYFGRTFNRLGNLLLLEKAQDPVRLVITTILYPFFVRQESALLDSLTC